MLRIPLIIAPHPNHTRKGYAGGYPAALQRPFRSLTLAGEGAIVKRGKQAIREADARKGHFQCLP
jgi:hypothetical protein